jgi:acyl carrier protein
MAAHHLARGGDAGGGAAHSVTETPSLEERVKRVMSDVLDLDPARIDSGSRMQTIDTWDSLAHINLCLGLEQEFSVSLSVPEIEAMQSYPDIVHILAGKAVA